MSTRGLWGFRYKGKDKLTYNHFDSYPDQLGKKICTFIYKHTLKQLKEIASKIQMVNKRTLPAAKQIEACQPWTDLSVGNQSENDWYCLLRAAQGTPSVYDTKLKYMIDDKNFIKDSLFCEYAYIINLDSKMLEFYVGFQDKNQNNRYKLSKQEINKQRSIDDIIYYNCKLVLELPLDEVNSMYSVREMNKQIN
jgi:hypothetical protein